MWLWSGYPRRIVLVTDLFPLAVNNLQRGQCSWWMHTEARAMLQHSGSTGKVKDLASLRSSGDGALIVRTHKITFAPLFLLTSQAWKKRWFVLRSGRLTGDPDVLEYYKNDNAKKPIRVIDLNLCEQVWRQEESTIWAYRQPCEGSLLGLQTWHLVPLSGGCWAVLQQEGLGAQLHIWHQDYWPRLLPGSRLRRRDEQVGPLHLWHLRL